MYPPQSIQLGSSPIRWLQPDSYADPQKTSLILNKDDIRCGWPATVAVQTKDQYGDVVHVPNMKVSQRSHSSASWRSFIVTGLISMWSSTANPLSSYGWTSHQPYSMS